MDKARMRSVIDIILEGRGFGEAIEDFRRGNRKWARKPFKDADLSNAALSRLDLSNLGFRDSNFEGADLRGANLRGAFFIDTDFREARLEGADCTDTTFIRCTFHCAKLQNARLALTVLEQVDLCGADLTGAQTFWLNPNDVMYDERTVLPADYRVEEINNLGKVGWRKVTP